MQKTLDDDTSETKGPFDLSILIEDLVEGVLAGYRFNHRSSSRGSVNANQSYASLVQDPILVQTVNVQQKPLSVILAVDERSTWEIRSEAGAWRRILVNLLGNALKYTTSGFVEVTLCCTDTVRTASPRMQTMVTVTVKDTGCGIGKDYLQHHLYTPFAQENTLAVGTGLGLSIVKQIANSLHGTIDIQSEVSVGTEVAVSIPIDSESSPANSEIATRYSNLTLCLLGFDVYPDLDSTPTGILSEASKLALALKTALATQAEQWFGLHVTSAQNAASINADIIAVTEDNLSILQVDGENDGHLRLPHKSSLLILCSDVLAEPPSKWKNSNRVECLAQPFGPRKMSKALAACLNHRQDELDPTLELARPLPKDTKSDRKIAFFEIISCDRLAERAGEVHPAKPVGSPVPFGENRGDQLPTMALPKILRKPHLLLVDDNAINLKVCVTENAMS